MAPSPKICKDCAPAARPRPIVEGSGGRCATHWREVKKRRKGNAHEKRVQKVYGLPPGGYDSLYDFQGGRCAICHVATGASRKLSVDHDHKTGQVRGLLCRPCNDMLGHIRDSRQTVSRMAQYLRWPPAQSLKLNAIHEEMRDD